MTERWLPLLEDPPELAGPLLAALRGILPSLFNLALQDPDGPTKPVSAGIEIDGDTNARLTVVGRALSRGDHGVRDVLFLSFDGNAQIRSSRLTISGDVILDLATNALLRLRLSAPIKV